MDGRSFNLMDSVAARVGEVASLFQRCRPRILILTDGLSYDANDAFGLTRFLEAITIHSGVTLKPVITLAHRTTSSVSMVTIGTSDVYPVQQNFLFDTATPAVTLANYDQIWLFGFDGGLPSAPVFTLSDAEVGVIAAFMNGGGGVFATGDHATLGYGFSGELPRIRHMREWVNIPMGKEAPSLAVNRIDTIVDPGSNGLYEFDDQADDIPQRIYPNYTVTGTATWSATVHPLLMLPLAVQTRADNTGFTLDIDVLPDHAHESVCYETPAAVLGGPYNVHGQNFAEYPPLALDLTKHSAATIVAYAVSGGRSVLNGVWKPPVRPQMFGVISAYDGREAVPYSGTARPGRIVCDSTWHHFVNVNLDGTFTTRNGLGTGSGSAFVPGPALEKIYAYYRNIVEWLQPANRRWCRWYWDLVALRYHPSLAEELAGSEKAATWREYVALGRTAERLLSTTYGSEAIDDTLAGVLLSEARLAGVGDLLVRARREAAPVDTRELTLGIVGGTLVKLANMLPYSDAKKARAVLNAGIETNVRELAAETARVAAIGLDDHAKRAERALAVLNDKALRKRLQQ